MRTTSPFHIRIFRFALIAIATLAVLTAAWYAYSITHPSPTPSVSSIPRSSRYWIMSSTALNDVTANTAARSAIAADTIFVTAKNTESLSSTTTGLHLVPTETFTSEATLQNALSKGDISSSAKAILYDNEDWSLTPQNEQDQPNVYYKKAASLAHSKGYIFIATPVSKTDSHVASQIAPYVDVLDIQSQYDQATATSYANHVLGIAKEIQTANPSTVILSGLSTNPPAGVPTSAELVDDAHSVQSIVRGFWLNIPTPGTACPKCHAPEPQIGIDFLTALGAV